MSATTPQNHPSFEELFKDVDTVPLALIEYLDLSFVGVPRVRPRPRGATVGNEAAEAFELLREVA